MSHQTRLNVGLKQDHVAIMRKSWGLTHKILVGEKTIETRWYKTKSRPWDRIFSGDRIFFKDSGNPVTIVATVKKVEQYENLTPKKVVRLLSKYAKKDGLGIDTGSIAKFQNLFRDKKYLIVVFLENAKKVKPFEIDKTGFGSQSAWITVDDIRQITV